jgi:hypothetical protein
MPRGKKNPTIEDIEKQGQVGTLAEVAIYQPGEPLLTDHVDIYDEANQFVRTYSFADHGVNFADLADQFIAGHPKCHKQ